MRLGFCFLALILAGGESFALADTIQNYVIVSASNLGPIGGTFGDGGTFGGTFRVDLTTLPTILNNSAALLSVNVTTTGGSLSGASYTSGMVDLVAQDITSFGEVDEYDVHLQGFPVSGQGAFLDLIFLEVPGTFAGGQVFQADEDIITSFNPFTFRQRSDDSGDAVAIDPASLAPEPGSVGICGLGLLGFAGARYVRRRRNDIMS